MGGDGSQIGTSIDGSKYGIEGQLDIKAASFSLSLLPGQDGVIAVKWNVGISWGIFSGSYGQVHHYEMARLPLFNNFYRYWNDTILSPKNPNNICVTHGEYFRNACGG